MQSNQLTPFTISYSPQIPELLNKLKCSLALSTYQAGKIVLISPHPDNEKLISLPRSFQKPMGMHIQDDRMVISTKDEVITFQNSKELASHYPNKQNTYDNIWLPRATFYSGQVDMHDIGFGKDGIYAINTSFSCICKIDGSFNFTPVWKPPFLDKIEQGDLCHLNGMVIQDGSPKYATALGTSTTPGGWRDNITQGGVLIDVEKNEIILDQLAMPHSPKMYNNELYMLTSANGEFIKVDVENKSYEVIKKFEGFCRGLSIHEDFAFIGFSKLRKNSSTFAKLKFSDQANFAGIKVVHIPTKSLVGEITYQTSVDEIYEVCVLKDMLRPNILNTMNELHKFSLAIPNKTFWAKPQNDK